MDKAKGGRFESGRQGWVGQGALVGEKMETTVLEKQLKIIKSKRMEGQIQCFPKVKLKEFIITKPLLHEMLKGLI